MSKLGVEGLRAEREALLEVARSLSDDELAGPSGCEGWSIRDVYAHLASSIHGVVDPAFLPDMSGGTEDAMEGPVTQRRDKPFAEVLDEYETFSEQALNFFAMAQEPPMAETMLPMNDLGTHPLSILANTFLFDAYCHLHHDILLPRGSVDRPEPPRDEMRLQPTVEWMLAGLPWMCAKQLAFMDRPVAFRLDGPGGGAWTIAPGGDEGRVQVNEGADSGALATITSNAHDFVAWGTKRTPWRDSVKVEGDEAYAARVLDAINII
jgi:uncharacterized protein (TIGR03083 family)